jgi:hypothetical protein
MYTFDHINCFPKVVRANRPNVITIRQLKDGTPLLPACPYTIKIYPTELLGTDDQPSVFTLQPQDGCLLVPYTFAQEQEFILRVAPEADAENNSVSEFRIYAVEEDLFDRRPYKGDLHIHSSRSDGQEPPAYVAAACRRIGIDFMAVTDHAQYAPSLEAIQAYAGLPIDLHIYPGEEIHPPENAIHMINFGGSASINDLFNDESRYRSEVQAIEDQITGIPAGHLRYQYASCLWCYQHIRAAGGLGLFCHPYWIHHHSYNVPEILISRHFADLPFGAYELIGGYHHHEVESNRLQVARYDEERARGRRIPIVGVSDAHGCENGSLFGWYSTLVFAPSPDLPALIQSIQDLFSVALETLPGETPHAHGPFRLARYAHFLLREVFPRHDALCAEEGRLMLMAINRMDEAVEGLRACQGRTAALFDLLWGSA